MADRFDDFKQVAGGAGQPIELPNCDYMSPRAVGRASGSVRTDRNKHLKPFRGNLGASGLVEGVELKSQPLIFGRDVSITYLYLNPLQML